MSRRAVIALFWPLALVACGFQPLYGAAAPGADTSDRLARIDIGIIPDRTGQQLRNELLDRITPRGQPADPEFRLSVDLSESSQNLAIRRDDTATLASLTLTAAYSLVSIADNRTVLAGTLRSVNSYDISRLDFATISAEADARERAATDLADGITARIAVFLADL